MSLIRLLRSPGSSPKTILTGCLAALPLLQCYSVVRNKDNHPVVVRTKFPLTRAMVPGLLECFKMGDGGAYKNAVKLAAETAKISTRKRQRDEVFGSEQLQQGHQDLSNVVWNSAIFPCRWLPVLQTMKIRAAGQSLIALSVWPGTGELSLLLTKRFHAPSAGTRAAQRAREQAPESGSGQLRAAIGRKHARP